jgi:hypothetical protein
MTTASDKASSLRKKAMLLTLMMIMVAGTLFAAPS